MLLFEIWFVDSAFVSDSHFIPVSGELRTCGHGKSDLSLVLELGSHVNSVISHLTIHCEGKGLSGIPEDAFDPRRNQLCF